MTSPFYFLQKYQPHQFSDMIGNQEVVEQIARMGESRQIPHLILNGPSGVGKTLSIHCLANCLYGTDPKKHQEVMLSLSSCDDRGIYAIRTRLRQFSQKKVSLPADIPKLIILEEADNLHQSSQQALRKMMEDTKTRFIFICQNISNIIEPLQSRCVLLNFHRITVSEMTGYLQHICETEKLDTTGSGIKTMTEISGGDLRIALNYLQSIYTCYGKITTKNVYSLTGLPPVSKIRDIVLQCFRGEINQAYQSLLDISHQGYSLFDILEVFMNICQQNEEMLFTNEELRLTILKIVAMTQIKVNDGANYLQIGSLLCQIARLHREFV
tara:strand:+ start:205 stop:1182 length:978 start_codon:yes stop_codon:yes gene_type:complete